jgi:hypothetical protein
MLAGKGVVVTVPVSRHDPLPPQNSYRTQRWEREGAGSNFCLNWNRLGGGGQYLTCGEGVHCKQDPIYVFPEMKPRN